MGVSSNQELVSAQQHTVADRRGWIISFASHRKILSASRQQAAILAPPLTQQQQVSGLAIDTDTLTAFSPASLA